MTASRPAVRSFGLIVARSVRRRRCPGTGLPSSKIRGDVRLPISVHARRLDIIWGEQLRSAQARIKQLKCDAFGMAPAPTKRAASLATIPGVGNVIDRDGAGGDDRRWRDSSDRALNSSSEKARSGRPGNTRVAAQDRLGRISKRRRRLHQALARAWRTNGAPRSECRVSTWGSMPCGETGFLDQRRGERGVLPIGNHPAHDVAAEDVEQDIEVEWTSSVWAPGAWVMSQDGQVWLGPVATRLGLGVAGMTALIAPLSHRLVRGH